jgi:hypothetical protein
MVTSSCVSHQYPSILITEKSFMKFGVKKSHKMISYILDWNGFTKSLNCTIK